MPDVQPAPTTQPDAAQSESFPDAAPIEHGATTPPIGPVGLPLDRIDGKLKVTGRAQYAFEAPVNGAATAVLITSPIGSGTLTAIDDSAVLAAPGVLAVVTPKNMPKLKGKAGIGGETRLPLSDMKIFYAGQYVAMVVADTIERAEHAAGLVKISYDAKPPVILLDDPRVTAEKPAKSFQGKLQDERGNVDAALKDSSLTVIKQTYDLAV